LTAAHRDHVDRQLNAAYISLGRAIAELGVCAQHESMLSDVLDISIELDRVIGALRQEGCGRLKTRPRQAV
jgi:hypothetical protein